MNVKRPSMLFISFRMFLVQIFSDAMLVVVCIAPLLAGLAFRFGVPFLEKLIEQYLGLYSVLSPYYLLFDLFLAILSPFMLCFASSMVMLEERDEGVGLYMAVTPAGRNGYLISRLVIPAMLSAPASAVVLLLFGLSGLSFGDSVLLSLCMPLVAMIFSLLITSFSGNRVEGMALAKLSGIMLAALAVPFFIQSPWKYLSGFLPTFWIAEYFVASSILSASAFFVTCLLCSLILYPRFIRKGIGC